MLHLRLIVPHELTGPVLERLGATRGVAHIVQGSGSATRPEGDFVLCDVAREAANEVVEWLQTQGVHRRGAITVEAVGAGVSDAAGGAAEPGPGQGAAPPG